MVGNNILVTGGAGYIGSHTVLQLLLGGYNTLVLDNSSLVSINRVKELAGYHGQYLTFHQVDLSDKPALEKVFSESKIDAVMHFDAVGESMADNLMGAITLLDVMAAHGCKKLVFSSSSTPKEVPCAEESPLSEMTPYGPTQLFNEDICVEVQRGDPEWRIMMLIYFNPVGAQPSSCIDEDLCGTPNNLIMPYVQQVVVRRLHKQKICGTDYTTKDGTSVGDYLQVVDLADGHICALQKLDDTEIGCEVYNLRTVKGTMVLEMVDASEKASGMCAHKIPLVRVGRRPGDPIEGDGVSEKSLVSGIQCLDLPIEADDVSGKSEGTALHKLSAYLLKQPELELIYIGRLMRSDYFPAELELGDLEFMESLVDILESHVLFRELHGTEVKEKLLEAKKLISDAQDDLKKAKKKLKEDKKEQEMN